MHKKPEISLIICTHNRAATLKNSLEYYKHLTALVPYEILVVINACTDDSIEVVKQAMKKVPQLSYTIESNIGLSNARNAGLQNAKAPFVFYIDDDAYPIRDIVDILSKLLITNDIKCISGITKYWDKNSPEWMKPSFVEVPYFRKDFGKMPNTGYINGCACGFSKSVLQELGGFDPNLGMKAKNVGYYDEVAAQRVIATAGHTIYYDPNLVVYHQSHSKTAWQFLASAYKKGEYRKKAQLVKPLKSFILGCLFLLKGTFLFIQKIPQGINVAVVESFSLPLIYFGQAFGK